MAGGPTRAQAPAQEPPPEDLPRIVLWRLRRSPLRRRTDLAQAWIGFGLLLAVLAGAPAAMFLVGDTAYRHYARTAEQEARTRQPTTAVLLHDAPRHPDPGSAEAEESRYRAEVRFTDVTGHPRTAKTDVRPGLPAGSTLRVWTDTRGRITGPPLTTDQIRDRSMGWAVTAFLTVTFAGGIAYAVTDRVLRHHHLAAWDAAWARTAPRWMTSI